MRTVPLSAKEEEFVPLRPRQILGGLYFWALLIYSIALLSITGAIAVRRHLWWDELDVYYMAIQPTFRAIVHSVSFGLDRQPPTYYIPLYYLVQWFGATPLVLRSIAIIPYWLATLVLYFTVARRTTPIYGFLAMLFPSLTLAFTYSFEARPYALVLLFSACAFLSWQLTHETKARRFALPALTLSIAAAFAVHYNACLVVLPFLGGEVILAARRRGFDFPVLLSICCGAFPVFFLFPNILAHRNFKVVQTSTALLERLSTAYQMLFSHASLLSLGILVALAIWLALPRRNGGDDRVLLSDFESLPMAVGGMFLSIPIVFCVVSYFTQTYYPRYIIETVIGAAILFVFVVHGLRRAIPDLADVLVVILLVAAMFLSMKRLRTPDEQGWGTFTLYAELFNRNNKAVYDSKEPMLLGQGSYKLALYYGEAGLRKRAFHVIGEPGSNMTPFAQSDRMIYKALDRLVPGGIHAPDYNSFIREHSRFLMYEPDQWVLDRLLADGQEIKVRARLMERPLYEVIVKSAPGRL
jgi:hypothetical protein